MNDKEFRDAILSSQAHEEVVITLDEAKARKFQDVETQWGDRPQDKIYVLHRNKDIEEVDFEKLCIREATKRLMSIDSSVRVIKGILIFFLVCGIVSFSIFILILLFGGGG